MAGEQIELQRNLENSTTKLNSESSFFSKLLQLVILPLILFVVCMLPIGRGVDVSDTMYSLSSDVLFPKAQGSWNLFMAYYLANFTGYLFTLLPFGHTLIGMNFYTSLVVYGSALLVYFHFGKRKEISYPVLFVSELIAVCYRWCPTTVLYNFLSYFLWIIVIILLRKALIDEKNMATCEIDADKTGAARKEKSSLSRCFAAGVILGVAVMVKFTNITAAILILLVLYNAFLTKEKAANLWKKAGFCVAGFAAGFGVLFFVMEIVYGSGTYMDMIRFLFGMTDTATDYQASSMLSDIAKYYLQVFPFLAGILVAVLAGVIFLIVAGKLDQKQKAVSQENAQKEGLYTRAARVIYVLCIPVLMRLYYGRGLFGTNYQDTFAIIFLGTLLVLFIALLCVWTMIRKKAQRVDKLDALLVLLLIFITPLGSNNGVYPLMDNLFLIVPLGISLLIKVAVKTPVSKAVQMPVITMFIAFFTLMLIQGVQFYSTFTFKGQDAGQICDTKITDVDVLTGMKTNDARSKILSDTLIHANEIVDKTSERKLFTFGDIPGFFFLLDDVQPVLTTTWPDLDSYEITYFEEELSEETKRIKEENCEKPVIILSKKNTNSQESEEVFSEEVKINKKEQLVKEFMDSLEYVMMFENERYEIWY